jgi:ASPIC and UnbV
MWRTTKAGGALSTSPVSPVSNDPRHVVGLGPATHAGRLTVHWPNGQTQHWDGLGIDRYWRLVEGKSRAE